MSTLFFKTLRESPADAEVPSHQLLVRAGYIRRAAPGGYTWLPLGLEVLNNVERIIREEMNAMGAQEVHFPALLPKEPYEASQRWVDYGPNMFRLVDRKGADYLLAPTHEEMFTLLVQDICGSYKDLPLNLYQIQTKYRDEARPRAGLLRGREFIMKDSYSFDLDEAGLQANYDLHRDAYIKIFDRLGLPYVIVSAMSGAMGGSASEEFLSPVAVGEDTFVRCTGCDYAANTEAVQVAPPTPRDPNAAPAAEPIDTPGTPTIATLVDYLNEAAPRKNEGDDRPWEAADTLKNLIVKLAHPDGTTEVVAIGVPGDRDVDEKRLQAQVEPAEVMAFTDEDFPKHPALVRGYIGPTGLGTTSASGIRYLVDPRIVEGTTWVTGNNVDGQHVLHLTMGRDFTPDGTIEAAAVLPGDPCPNCDGELEMERGVEMGHIFQLGTRYADALGLKVQDEAGKQVTVTMGSYGIGVTRAVAVLAEANHDELGLCWPAEVAPADVHVVIAGKEGGPQRPAAESLAADLEAAGLRVMIDDREGVSPGVRFKDAELIGVPTIVVAGRGIPDGVVEVKDRRTGERTDMTVDQVVSHLSSGR